MNVNKTFHAGRLTRDPQISYLPSQTAVVEFGLAVNRNWMKDGIKQEEVLFIECKMYGKRAEVINKYIDKGDPIFIEGHLKIDTWKQDDGHNRSKTYIVVDNFEFVSTTEKQAEGYNEPAKKEVEQQVDDDGEIPF